MRNFIIEHSFGGILGNTFYIYRSHFAAVVLPFALLAGPFQLLQIWAQVEGPGVESGVFLVAVLLNMLAGFLAYAAIVVSVSEICLGSEPSVFRSLRHAFSEGLVVRLLAAGFLLMIVVALGLVLLVIPGLLFMLWFIYVQPIILIEGSKVLNAFGRSRALGSGYYIRTAGVILVLGVGAGIAAGLVGVVLILSTENPALAGFVQLLILLATTPLTMTALVLMYYDLRARKEAYNTVGLSEELNL